MTGLYIALILAAFVIVAGVVSGMMGGKNIEKPTRLFNLFRRRRHSGRSHHRRGVRA